MTLSDLMKVRTRAAIMIPKCRSQTPIAAS